MSIMGDDYWNELKLEIKAGENQYSDYKWIHGDDLARLFYVSGIIPLTDTEIYFGVDDDYKNEYKIKLISPFECTAGQVAVVDKTIGGSLFARRVDCLEEMCTFIADYSAEYIKRNPDLMFYVDVGLHYKNANEIMKKWMKG